MRFVRNVHYRQKNDKKYDKNRQKSSFRPKKNSISANLWGIRLFCRNFLILSMFSYFFAKIQISSIILLDSKLGGGARSIHEGYGIFTTPLVRAETKRKKLYAFKYYFRLKLFLKTFVSDVPFLYRLKMFSWFREKVHRKQMG